MLWVLVTPSDQKKSATKYIFSTIKKIFQLMQPVK